MSQSLSDIAAAIGRDRFKRMATRHARELAISPTKSLDTLSSLFGYRNWQGLSASFDACAAAPGQTAPRRSWGEAQLGPGECVLERDDALAVITYGPSPGANAARVLAAACRELEAGTLTTLVLRAPVAGVPLRRVPGAEQVMPLAAWWELLQGAEPSGLPPWLFTAHGEFDRGWETVVLIGRQDELRRDPDSGATALLLDGCPPPRARALVGCACRRLARGELAVAVPRALFEEADLSSAFCGEDGCFLRGDDWNRLFRDSWLTGDVSDQYSTARIQGFDPLLLSLELRRRHDLGRFSMVGMRRVHMIGERDTRSQILARLQASRQLHSGSLDVISAPAWFFEVEAYWQALFGDLAPAARRLRPGDTGVRIGPIEATMTESAGRVRLVYQGVAG